MTKIYFHSTINIIITLTKKLNRKSDEGIGRELEIATEEVNLSG
ncbi:MAG: hypothetical protein ACRC0Y_12110 [Fusobacteriaceae bacterium]